MHWFGPRARIGCIGSTPLPESIKITPYMFQPLRGPGGPISQFPIQVDGGDDAGGFSRAPSRPGAPRRIEVFYLGCGCQSLPPRLQACVLVGQHPKLKSSIVLGVFNLPHRNWKQKLAEAGAQKPSLSLSPAAAHGLCFRSPCAQKISVHVQNSAVGTSLGSPAACRGGGGPLIRNADQYLNFAPFRRLLLAFSSSLGARPSKRPE